MPKFLAILLLTLVAIVLSLASAGVFYLMWGWFAVAEFHAPTLTFRQAVVVAIFQSHLLGHTSSDTKEDEDAPADDDDFWIAQWGRIGRSAGVIAVELAVAAFWHWVLLR